MHPASPFVRGWVALAAIGFFFFRDTFERMLRGGPLVDEQLAGRAPWLLLGGGVLLLLTVLGYILSWYFTRYQVAEGYVRLNTGFLFKQQRQARLDRVQAIDIVQPLLARIFGLAELKFEVADAGESAVRLAYLRMDEARQLRAAILARAAGVVPDPAHPGEAAAEAPEHAVLTVPPRRLIGSLLLSEQSVFIVVGAVASVVLSALTENRSFYLFLIPAVLGMAAAYWNSINRGYNFTAAISPDGIRLRYGLLDTQAQTLPPGRIQALRVSQPPLWRIFGWYRIQVNVAGYGAAGSDGESSSRTTLLPVGTFPDVLTMLSLVLPDPGTPDPVGIFRAGISGLAGRRDPAVAGDARRGRRRLRHHPAARPAAGTPGLAPQRLHRHRHGPADPLGPLVAPPRGGPAPAHPIHGAGAGPPGAALPRGGPGPAHHRRAGVPAAHPGRPRRGARTAGRTGGPRPGRAQAADQRALAGPGPGARG